jgi:adenylyltransferase/sulfurtransferase
MVELTLREVERYDRQIKIRGFGIEAQKKLKNARVVVAGVGGLGCIASTYLVAAGIGEVVLVDMGEVELNNLNRQILYWEEDVGKTKIKSALEKLRRLNSEVKVEGLKIEIKEENIASIIKEADVVVDGMDNFKARFLLNKACVNLGIPFVHAAVYELTGELMTIIPGKGPCYQCYVVKEISEAKPIPVLGATPGVMACLETIETVKLITGIGKPLVGKLLFFDGLNMEFRTVDVKRVDDCPVCGSLG